MLIRWRAVVFKRRNRVGAATGQGRKFINVLYPKRTDSQVTPLGVYKTNYGRTVRAPR